MSSRVESEAAAPQGSSLLQRLHARVARQSGWRAALLAFVSGLISAGAFAPVSIVPLLIPTFVVLMWQLAAAERGSQALWRGWFFGTGHFLGGLYWVGIAMTVDIERFWWFLPISIAGLSAGLAIFIALVAWATWRARLTGAASLSLFVLLWMVAEWLRSWVLSGFPWNLIGSAWSEVPVALQLASVTGVWGLSAITLLAAVSLAALTLPGSRRSAFAFIGLSWGLLAAALLFGILRLSAAPSVWEGPTVRLVQPSVPQSLKWDAGRAFGHVRQLVELSRKPGFDQVALVVWPETAVPFNLWRDPDLIRFIGQAAPPEGALVTGAPRYLPDGEGFNALHVVTQDGGIVETYDKVHLVPFGEYVPLGDFLGGLDIAVTRGSLSSGPGLTALPLPGLPTASPLICYEVIFPGKVVASDQPRPGFLLNLTNDAWFGNSSGPYQHFASAKLRAAEEGLPLVRAANNGISAMIDPYGRVIAALALNERAALDSPLPPPLPSTFFARSGNFVLLGLFAALLLTTYTFARFSLSR
ncbi:MAG: apolipoprotein N-acyltransferase [Pseudomonadota bacterium]